jgi:hypothetical protein
MRKTCVGKGENMKNKRLALFLTVLLIFSLSGCGTKTKEDNGSKTENNTTQSNTDTNQSNNTIADNTAGTNDNTGSVQNTGTNTGETIEEQVLYDQKGIKITALSMKEDPFLGSEINLLIENSSKINSTVQVRDVSVNDFMIEPTFSSDVAAGKKANDSISFLQQDLERNAIGKIATVEFRFSIFNTDTFDTIAESDIITINTSAKDTYVQNYDDSGKVIYESGNVRIIDKGLASDELLGPEIKVYIENNSKKYITVQTQNVSVNGYMVEPIFSSDIAPGKKTNDGITFTDLADNGIDKISDVELTFLIFDTSSLETIAESDVIKLKYQ